MIHKILFTIFDNRNYSFDIKFYLSLLESLKLVKTNQNNSKVYEIENYEANPFPLRHERDDEKLKLKISATVDKIRGEIDGFR